MAIMTDRDRDLVEAIDSALRRLNGECGPELFVVEMIRRSTDRRLTRIYRLVAVALGVCVACSVVTVAVTLIAHFS
jgi:hypothetical protein